MQHYVASDLDSLGRAGAVNAIRGFLRATAEGHTDAPPRLDVPVSGRRLIFTIGADASADIAGFRLYSIDKERGTHDDSQALLLLRLSTGEVLASATGGDFGAWRTAALGAVAMDEATKHLDRPLRMGLLGAGFQAYHHARTWIAARPIERVHVWARRFEAAQAFAAELAMDTGVEVLPEATAALAVQGADAVLGVTRGETPVVEASALPPEGYLATVGPKFGGRNELPAEAYASADVLFSDAPTQCAKFEQVSGPLPGGRTAAEMLSLADVVAGKAALPKTGRLLFVSEGLAGSEVALLAALHAQQTQP